MKPITLKNKHFKEKFVFISVQQFFELK
jgi:hypothetical protein